MDVGSEDFFAKMELSVRSQDFGSRARERLGADGGGGEDAMKGAGGCRQAKCLVERGDQHGAVLQVLDVEGGGSGHGARYFGTNGGEQGRVGDKVG